MFNYINENIYIIIKLIILTKIKIIKINNNIIRRHWILYSIIIGTIGIIIFIIGRKLKKRRNEKNENKDKDEKKGGNNKKKNKKVE